MDKTTSSIEQRNDPLVQDIYSKINESAFAVLLSFGLFTFFGLRYAKRSATSILNSDRAGHFFETIQQVSRNQVMLEELRGCDLQHKESLNTIKDMITSVHYRIDLYAPLIETQADVQKRMVQQLEDIDRTLNSLREQVNDHHIHTISGPLPPSSRGPNNPN